MPNKYFKYSVILLIVYEILLQLLSPANGSLLKLVISLLFLGSFISLAIYFIQNYKFHRLVFKPVFIVLLALLILGIMNILRSFQFDVQSIITLFGNKNTGLAMLLPLVIILGSKFENLVWYNNLSILMLKIGFVLLPLSFLISDIQFFSFFQISFLLLPITIFGYQKRADKTIIIISSVLIISLSISWGGRLSIIQIIFLWLGVLFYYLQNKMQLNGLRKILIALLVSFPFIVLIFSFPLFDYVAADTDTIGLIETTDTRTFLYQEVTEDLSKNNSIIFGKGAMGKYFSGYFYQGVAGGDNENRINVEVGVLSMLLKGGIVNLVLNIVLILFAIYYSFNSKNKLTENLVFLVICHLLSLFIADIPQYSTFSFTMWIAIGACISSAVRSISNETINNLFKTKNKIL